MSGEKLKFAIVCSSNMNRSMEAHCLLSRKRFNVRSFGVSNVVKLPGSAPDRPNVYDFNTTYAEIYKDLVMKDKQLYTHNGILNMLDRNRRIKSKPERFQECRDKFDVVISCEERVFDQIIEDLELRQRSSGELVHVINLDIQDSHDEATIGAFYICELCALGRHDEFHLCLASQLELLHLVTLLEADASVGMAPMVIEACKVHHRVKALNRDGIMFEQAEDLDSEIDTILFEFEKKCNLRILHVVSFY